MKNSIKKGYRNNLRALQQSNPDVYQFLKKLESLEKDVPTVWLSTVINAHLYVDRQFIAYIKFPSESEGITFSSRPNSQIRQGTTDASGSFFQQLLIPLIEQYDDSHRWASQLKTNSRHLEINFLTTVPKKFWDQLHTRILDIHEFFAHDKIIDSLKDVSQDMPIEQPTVKEHVQKIRIGQYRFRESLIEKWKGRCAVTGFNKLPLLRASHIKPWKDSTDKERLDPSNGFLLTPNLDAAFDQGFITFNEKGKIKISEGFKDKATDFGIKDEMFITLDYSHEKYLRYHRRHVYKNEDLELNSMPLE